MSKANVIALVLGFVFCLVGAGVTGCGQSASPEEMIAKATDSNLKRLTKMYTMFMKNNEWRGPKDEEDFKAYLGMVNGDLLLAMGIDPAGLDSLFVNENDGKPFKIRWGVEGSFRSSFLPVIFEAEPSSGGEYLVGFSGSIVKQVDQSEYDQLWRGERDHSAEGAESRR